LGGKPAPSNSDKRNIIRARACSVGITNLGLAVINKKWRGTLGRAGGVQKKCQDNQGGGKREKSGVEKKILKTRRGRRPEKRVFTRLKGRKEQGGGKRNTQRQTGDASKGKGSCRWASSEKQGGGGLRVRSIKSGGETSRGGRGGGSRRSGGA